MPVVTDYIKLRNTLAELFWDKSSAQRIVADANIRRERVTFSDNAIENWSNIIQEADKQGLLIRLVELVLQEYPTNEVLNDVLSRMKKHVSSGVVHKESITKSESLHDGPNEPSLVGESSRDEQQAAIEVILSEIEDKFGYNWMFVSLRTNVVNQGSQQSIDRLDEWLREVQSFPPNMVSKYRWQLLCMDKHIQLIGIKDMTNQMLTTFSKQHSLKELDAPRFLRFAAEYVHTRVQSILTGSEALTSKQNLAKYAYKLNQTLAEIDALEKELAAIKYMLEVYECLANEDDVPLPQNKMDSSLTKLRKQLKNSIGSLKPTGAPVLVRSKITSHLKALNEQIPEYRNWLLETATNIEASRKHVFSLN